MHWLPRRHESGQTEERSALREGKFLFLCGPAHPQPPASLSPCPPSTETHGKHPTTGQVGCAARTVEVPWSPLLLAACSKEPCLVSLTVRTRSVPKANLLSRCFPLHLLLMCLNPVCFSHYEDKGLYLLCLFAASNIVPTKSGHSTTTV